MTNEIKVLLIEKLREKEVCIVSDDETEYTIRCPYCGDSSTPTHGHLNIRINPDDDSGLPWHCFRCGASGKVTDDFLDDIEVLLDEEAIKQLKLYNRKAAKLSGRKTIVQTENYKVPLCTVTALNDKKLYYINDRLGTCFNYEMAQSHKIVLSLNEFMLANGLYKIEGVKSWTTGVLERDYVGFLSSNNNLLTFRNIRNDPQARRYYKIILNEKNDSPTTFYSIPTQLELLYEGELNVHIAEGTFDILSIKYNLEHRESNAIFYASCGYSYANIVKALARSGIIPHMNIHIYADRDKTDSDHMALIRRNAAMKFAEHLYLHRNGKYGQKDYGVPRDYIVDRCRQLW
jgi:hypothetical protein